MLLYSSTWNINERVFNFFYPHSQIWSGSEEEDRKAISTIYSRLSPQHREMFLATCAASALLSDKAYVKGLLNYIGKSISPLRLGLPFGSWQQMAEWRWVKVSVPLVGDIKGKDTILCIVVGGGKGAVKCWATDKFNQLLSEESRESLQTCLELFGCIGQDFNYLFWPLFSSEEIVAIRGCSLSLPIYLALFSLTENIPINDEIVATGCIIRGSSKVHRVSELTRKIRICKHYGFKAIIVPSDNKASFHRTPEIDILFANDLDTAKLFWANYSTNMGIDLAECLYGSSIESKIQAFYAIPNTIMPWLKKKMDVFPEEISQNILEEFKGEHIISTLERYVADSDFDIDKTNFLLRNIELDFLDELVKRRPALAYRLTQLKLIVANHKGEPDEASLLSRKLDQFFEYVRCYEDCEKKLLMLYNLIIVQLHNKYCFIPDVLQKLDPNVVSTLTRLEGLYKIRKETTPNAVDFDIGAFYGTLAQNYGFCGPTYKEQFEACLTKALEAFGNGKVPERPFEEWRRDISYRVYVSLDCQDFACAKEALLTYLQVEELDRYNATKNPYEHAALMRYIADTNTACSYLDWAEGHLNDRPNRHPWQLWLFNLGRFFFNNGLTERSRQAWLSSLGVCLSEPGGITIKVMGLLPLCFLYAKDLISERWVRTVSIKIKDLIGSGRVDLNHFQTLLDAGSWNDLLELAYKNWERLFPFTYH